MNIVKNKYVRCRKQKRNFKPISKYNCKDTKRKHLHQNFKY